MNESALTSFEDQPGEATKKAAGGAKPLPKKSKIPLLATRVSPRDISPKKSVDISGRKHISPVETKKRPSKIPLSVKGKFRKEEKENWEVKSAKYFSRYKSVDISGRKDTSSVETKKRPSRIPLPVKGNFMKEKKENWEVKPAIYFSRKKSRIPVAVNKKRTTKDPETESIKDNLKSKALSKAYIKVANLEEHHEAHRKAPNTTENTADNAVGDMVMEYMGSREGNVAGSKDIVPINDLEIFSININNITDENVGKDVARPEIKAFRSKIPIFVAEKTTKKKIKKIKITLPIIRNISTRKSRIPIATNRLASFNTSFKNGARNMSARKSRIPIARNRLASFNTSFKKSARLESDSHMAPGAPPYGLQKRLRP